MVSVNSVVNRTENCSVEEEPTGNNKNEFAGTKKCFAIRRPGLGEQLKLVNGEVERKVGRELQLKMSSILKSIKAIVNREK